MEMEMNGLCIATVAASRDEQPHEIFFTTFA